MLNFDRISKLSIFISFKFFYNDKFYITIYVYKIEQNNLKNLAEARQIN